MDSDWTASALFSPSKARVQQAQAKDWAAVDLWLARHYGPRLPMFERNEDTLQALLALASHNDSADEQHGRIERIEKTVYNAMTKPQHGVVDEIIVAMLAELASETHLDTLAELIVVSDCPSADVAHVASKIVRLVSSEFEARQQLRRVESQVESTKQEQVRLQKRLDELRGNEFQTPANMVELTTEWQKTTKYLKAKIAEYEERLGSARSDTAPYSIEGIQKRTEDVALQRSRLKSLDAQLRAYRNLPTDVKAAIRHVEDARDKLRQLTLQRDELFETLAKS